MRIHKLNPSMTSRPGIEPVTPWWKAIVFATATTLLFLMFSLLLPVDTELVHVPDSESKCMFSEQLHGRPNKACRLDSTATIGEYTKVQ